MAPAAARPLATGRGTGGGRRQGRRTLGSLGRKEDDLRKLEPLREPAFTRLAQRRTSRERYAPGSDGRQQEPLLTRGATCSLKIGLQRVNGVLVELLV